jgi:pyruvate-formate lyase-activating enzyme
LPTIGTLNRQPLEAFENFTSLHASCHPGNSGPSPRAIKVLRDLLLESVDQRLQAIYLDHFRRHPPAPGATHEQKIAALEATRNDVQAVLNCYDWSWFEKWLELWRFGETAEISVRRLANFAFPIQMVNFRFTYHCNIACRHCYNNSGPHRKAERIPLETMLEIVAQMPETGIRRLNLSGGEPFLYQDDVLALVAAGRAAGLDVISIYTNGFWASTDERAARILERLEQRGFMRKSGDHIKVSGGVYHQEFIAFDRILILARNYYARFGQPLLVDIELPPGSSAMEEDIRHRITAAGLTDRVKLYIRRYVSPIGRAEGVQEIQNGVTDTPPCGTINQIAFDPDGSVRPCCGASNEHHGIIIGRSGEHLKNLAKSMQNDPILQFIATRRMGEIFAYVPAAPKKDGYGGRCHLCLDALGRVTDKEPLQAALFGQQRFYPFWFTHAVDRKDSEFISNEPSPAIA